MLVAEVVIQTRPGRAASVRESLRCVSALEDVRVEDAQTLRAIWWTGGEGLPESFAEAVQALDGDIVAAEAALVELA